MNTQNAHLNKSRYMNGRICKKRLWFLAHEPVLNAEESAESIAASIGEYVGVFARKLFPEGRAVGFGSWKKALAETSALMADESVSAIFEAAVEWNGARVRCDILERTSSGKWTLREVKSSKSVKDDYLYDVAFQVLVLQGAGVNLDHFGIQHINGDYRRGEGGVAVNELFIFADLTKNSKMPFDEVERSIPESLAVLQKSDAPAAPLGLHCKECEFLERCRAGMPNDWIAYLPRINAKKFNALSEMGVESVSDIPGDFELTGNQAVVRDVWASKQDYISPDLRKGLSGFGPPAFYLDFEVMAPAVPLYPGTGSYESVPFQWSVHYRSGAGELSHHEFLAEGSVDPRRELAEKLIAILSGSEAPVLAYSSYESRILGELKGSCPDLATGIDGVLNRLQDLKNLVSQYTQLRGYKFSHSIKNVAPALSPEFGYDDLESVTEGMGAAVAFERIVRGDLAADESEKARKELLAYCKRDTEAMVKVHEALIDRA